MGDNTFQPLGALLGVVSQPPARSREPVRRGSRLRGREGTHWRPTRRRDARQIVLAAKRFELRGRTPGHRSGPLGTVAIEVLELLANLVDPRTGRLDPSIVTMTRMLRRSRDAIVRALANLRRHGFIDWLRRYEPTGNETGPQVRQASNAYRLAMPERGSDALGAYGESPPPPDDDVQRRAEWDQEREAMTAQLPLPKRAWHHIEPGPLADALARLGRHVAERAEAAERESAERTEPLSPSIPTSENAGASA